MVPFLHEISHSSRSQDASLRGTGDRRRFARCLSRSPSPSPRPGRIRPPRPSAPRAADPPNAEETKRTRPSLFRPRRRRRRRGRIRRSIEGRVFVSSARREPAAARGADERGGRFRPGRGLGDGLRLRHRATRRRSPVWHRDASCERDEVRASRRRFGETSSPKRAPLLVHHVSRASPVASRR